MATTGTLLLRSQALLKPHPLRSLSTSTSTSTTASAAASNHQFLPPSEYLSSWNPPNDPNQAQAELALLRREYATKVKDFRKEYVQEVELQRAEKQRKDEAKRESIRIANEETEAAKAATKKARAAEREVAEEEFRQTPLKERADKLEYWRTKEKHIEEKRKEENELLRRRSSMWVAEAELEKEDTGSHC